LEDAACPLLSNLSGQTLKPIAAWLDDSVTFLIAFILILCFSVGGTPVASPSFDLLRGIKRSHTKHSRFSPQSSTYIPQPLRGTGDLVLRVPSSVLLLLRVLSRSCHRHFVGDFFFLIPVGASLIWRDFFIICVGRRFLVSKTWHSQATYHCRSTSCITQELYVLRTR
jgi:hypothetical protein